MGKFESAPSAKPEKKSAINAEIRTLLEKLEGYSNFRATASPELEERWQQMEKEVEKWGDRALVREHLREFLSEVEKFEAHFRGTGKN